MSQRVDNELLLSEIRFIKEGVAGINEHLRVLNGQVAKNTAFRNRQAVINGILGFVSGGVFMAVVGVIFKFVF